LKILEEMLAVQAYLAATIGCSNASRRCSITSESLARLVQRELRCPAL
jgi:hypothetical protein